MEWILCFLQSARGSRNHKREQRFLSHNLNIPTSHQFLLEIDNNISHVKQLGASPVESITQSRLLLNHLRSGESKLPSDRRVCIPRHHKLHHQQILQRNTTFECSVPSACHAATCVIGHMLYDIFHLKYLTQEPSCSGGLPAMPTLATAKLLEMWTTQTADHGAARSELALRERGQHQYKVLMYRTGHRYRSAFGPEPLL